MDVEEEGKEKRNCDAYGGHLISLSMSANNRFKYYHEEKPQQRRLESCPISYQIHDGINSFS